MQSLPGKGVSYWIDSIEPVRYPALQGGAQVDVAIVGAGMVGISAAHLLKQAGRTVAVIESRRAAEQVTGHTTAKLTSLHGLIYAELTRNFGERTARLYAEANQAAIEYVAQRVAEQGIDCNFERKAAYTYSESGQGLGTIHEEVEAATRLGLPASFVSDPPLPYKVAGAIRFDNQAQFHPLKYLSPLLQGIPGDGSQVFEETRVLDIEQGKPNRVLTDKGTVLARDVIVATNLPFMHRGAYFARVFPHRHEILAARIPADNAPDGMFISIDQPSFSVRTQPVEGGTLLIAVGPGFKTGTGDTGERFRELEQFVRNHFNVESFEYHWGNQDYYSPDRIPFVGKLTADSRRVYIATGFSGWGMSNGIAAAMILSDHILERPNPWAKVFDANRLNLRVSGKQILTENFDVAKGWVSDRINTERLKDRCDVPRGSGAVCKRGKEMVAVYKHEDGTVYELSPRCTHLGCLVSWNNAEKSWDCPCHGSRFGYDGKVLQGPAVRDLPSRAEED